jgi:hypothetical protein
MAVEAQARFEAQRIARAEPDRLDLGLAQQRLGQPDGVASGTEISNPSSPV